MKQTKNIQNKEKGYEEKKYELEDKMEKITGRRQKANKIREMQLKERNMRIQSAIAKKERGPSDDGANSSSARSAQGVWKSLVFRDQQDKIERMHEVQKAYKERLIEEMIYKEEKYKKVQDAKNHLVKNASMTPDYGSYNLMDLDQGRMGTHRNSVDRKNIFNPQKSVQTTNIQIR